MKQYVIILNALIVLSSIALGSHPPRNNNKQSPHITDWNKKHLIQKAVCDHYKTLVAAAAAEKTAAEKAIT